jgi:putative transposase
VLDEPFLLTAACYIELNPARAGLAEAPSRYRWSSATPHVRGRDDTLVWAAPLLKLVPNWRGALARVIREEDRNAFLGRVAPHHPNFDFVIDVRRALSRAPFARYHRLPCSSR